MIDLLKPDWGQARRVKVTGPTSRVEGGWSLTTNVGPLVLTAYAGGVFRLRLGEAEVPDYGILINGPDVPPPTEIAEASGHWSVSAHGNAVGVDREARLALDRGERTILASQSGSPHAAAGRLPPLARLDDGSWFVALGLGSGDAVYGLGEKWGRLNRRGQLVTSWIVDPDGATGEASYKNNPFAWSPRGWGVFIHTPGKVVHGVGFAQWSNRAYGILVEDAVLDLFLIAGADGAEILERYTVLTGRPASTPLWSLGVWHGVVADHGPAGTAERLRQHRIPGDVLVAGAAAVPSETDRPKAARHKAQGLGFRICEPEASRESVDLADPGAYTAFRDRQRERFEAGIDVLAPDVSGPDAATKVATSGSGSAGVHNIHHLLRNRCLFEAAAQYARNQPLVFSRTGWSGSQRYPLQRGGDAALDWEGLSAVLRGSLSWGLSGGACYVGDFGTDVEDQPEEQLYARWIQVAVFFSHTCLRLHGTVQPDALSAPTRAVLDRHLALRYRLLPYIEGVLAEATSTGLPVMRAMPLAFPTEAEGWAFDTQFMFGPDMLIVPVTTPDNRVRTYLPQGNWIDFWTDEVVAGGRRLDLTAVLDHIPVFVREGAVLPFGPSVEHTGELNDQTQLERLVVYREPKHAPCLARHGITVLGDRLQGVPEGVVIELINH